MDTALSSTNFIEELWNEIREEVDWQAMWDAEGEGWNTFVEQKRMEITPEITVDQVQPLELDFSPPIDYNMLAVDWEEEVNKETTQIIQNIEKTQKWERSDVTKECRMADQISKRKTNYPNGTKLMNQLRTSTHGE